MRYVSTLVALVLAGGCASSNHTRNNESAQDKQYYQAFSGSNKRELRRDIDGIVFCPIYKGSEDKLYHTFASARDELVRANLPTKFGTIKEYNVIKGGGIQLIKEYTRDEELEIASQSINKAKSEAAKRVLEKRLLHKNKL